MKVSTTNPIRRTLTALALGAAIITSSSGCASHAMRKTVEVFGQAATDISGRRYVKTTITTEDLVRGAAGYNKVAFISSRSEYAACIQTSFSVPVLLATYSRFDKHAVDPILDFCHYTPSIAVEKRVIADDAAELEGIVGQVLKSGQNIIILDKGKSYGCKLEDLSAWVEAYKRAQEKEPAKK